MTAGRSQSKLYHRRPPDLRGDFLYPLNQLRDVAPDVYRSQRAKYDGREVLMAQRIPWLDCLWNDVLHLSPVHPALIRDLAVAAGFAWQTVDWFEIDPLVMGFDQTNAAIMLHLHPGSDTVAIQPEEFEPFLPERCAELCEIPQRTRDAYEEARDGVKRHFLFAGIPHVLYRGALDIRRLAVIQL